MTFSKRRTHQKNSWVLKNKLWRDVDWVGRRMMRDEKNKREKEAEDLDLVVSGKIKEPLKWSEGKVTQSCLSLCNPTDYTVHRILQARILEQVAVFFCKESSQPSDQTQVSHIAGGFFTRWATCCYVASVVCDSVWPHRRQPPGSPVPGILQARTLEWVAISFSNAWKWKVKVKSLSRVRLFVTPLQPTRLLHPWDFPGKRTGVGCHCLLQ